MSIGMKIKELRKLQKMSLDDLAKLCNTTRQTIYKYEKGIVTNIPHDRIVQLAFALNTTPDELFGWENQVGETHRTILQKFDSACIAAENYLANAICNMSGSVNFNCVPDNTVNYQNNSVLTESEKKMLDLFQQIPENKQQTMLSIMQVFVDGCRPEGNSEGA